MRLFSSTCKSSLSTTRIQMRYYRWSTTSSFPFCISSLIISHHFHVINQFFGNLFNRISSWAIYIFRDGKSVTDFPCYILFLYFFLDKRHQLVNWLLACFCNFPFPSLPCPAPCNANRKSLYTLICCNAIRCFCCRWPRRRVYE